MEKSKMKLDEIVKTCNLQVACGEEQLMKEVSGGYSSDLLSDVMANSKKGDIWITLQIHPNVVAVAMLKELAGIVMINGRKPEDETIKRYSLLLMYARARMHTFVHMIEMEAVAVPDP